MFQHLHRFRQNIHIVFIQRRQPQRMKPEYVRMSKPSSEKRNYHHSRMRCGPGSYQIRPFLIASDFRKRPLKHSWRKSASSAPRTLTCSKCCGSNECPQAGTQVQNPGSVLKVRNGPSLTVKQSQVCGQRCSAVRQQTAHCALSSFSAECLSSYKAAIRNRYLTQGQPIAIWQ